MKKITKISIALFTTLAPISTVLVACKNTTDEKKKETPGYQAGFLKQESSKNQMILSVLNTYLETFYANDLKNTTIDTAIENKDNKLYKDLYDIFKYYATTKLNLDAQIFWNLKYELIKIGIDTKNYNPAPSKLPTEEEFIFLMKNSKFLSLNLRLELQKLLISKLYLLKSRDEFKKLSNNEHGIDKYQLSLEEEMKKESTSQLKKDIYNSLDLTSDNLYLMKYLIENPLVQKWSFIDDRDMNLRIGQANVSTFEDFNNLASYNPSKKVQYDYNPVAKNPEFLLNTGSSEAVDLKTLRAYSGLLSNTENSGDLDNSLYAIRKAQSPIFGFVDPKTKKVYDQDYFKFAKILAKEKNIPKIKATVELKTKEGKEENLKVFSAKDIEFDGLKRDNSNEKLFTKSLTLDSDSKVYTLQFEINGLLTFSGQFLRVPIKLSVKELGKRHYYEFNSDLEYKNNKFEDQTKENAYNLDKYPTFVDMIKNNKIDAAYSIKIAPMYLSKSTKNSKGEQIDKKLLTFEQTPWLDKEQQNILTNNIIVSKGNSLFREANKYILDNLGFKLKDLNPIVLELFKVEGLI
ncbi:HinT-interacting membrane complex lipoprotein P60 [Metamycoplasma canadense]|nr:hypothetical protein [Metamycoplasma canadense]